MSFRAKDYDTSHQPFEHSTLKFFNSQLFNLQKSLRIMFPRSTTPAEYSLILTPESGSDHSDDAWIHTGRGDGEADFSEDNGPSASSNLRIRNPSVSVMSSGSRGSPNFTPASTQGSERSSRESTIEQFGDRLRRVDLSATGSRANTPSRSSVPNRMAAESPPIHLEERLRPDSRHGTPGRDSAGRRRRSTSQINHRIHNVVDEEPPQGPFYDPNFQAALLNSRAQLQNLQHILESSSLHTDPVSAIYNLYNRAVQLANYHCPTTRKVALVGGSGVGKGSSALDMVRTYHH